MTGEGAMAMQGPSAMGALPTGLGPRGLTVVQAALVSAVLWIAVAIGVAGWSHAPWRASLALGLACAVASGAAGLAIVAFTESKPLNMVLLGRVSAFMGRIGLIAIGLVLTRRVFHGQPFGFVATFFPLFFASTLLEQLVWMAGRTKGAPGVPGALGGDR